MTQVHRHQSKELVSGALCAEWESLRFLLSGTQSDLCGIHLHKLVSFSFFLLSCLKRKTSQPLGKWEPEGWAVVTIWHWGGSPVINHGNDCRATPDTEKASPVGLQRGHISGFALPFAFGIQLWPSTLWRGKDITYNVISTCFLVLFLTLYSQIETNTCCFWNDFRRCWWPLRMSYRNVAYQMQARGGRGQNPSKGCFLGGPHYLFLSISENCEMTHFLQALLWFVQIPLNSICSAFFLMVKGKVPVEEEGTKRKI